MRIVLAAALGGTLCMAPPAVAAAASEAAAQDASEKMICKRDRNSRATGSNLRVSERICKTQSEWDRLEKDAQDTRRRLDDRSVYDVPDPVRGGGPTAGGPPGGGR